MPKRDIYKISESEQPRTLFRKPQRRLLTSQWFWLVLVMAAVMALDYFGLIDVWGLFSSISE